LNDEKVKLYLRRVGFVITFGGAPPPDIENDQLLDILRSQAKWINDSTTFCVRSTECSTYVDGINKVCRQCHDLRKSKNAIDKPMPKEKNKKYTSLVLYKNSPFYQYCKNANVMELLEYFNDPEDLPPFVLGIISNNSENVLDVYKIHKQVLELAAYFKIHILSIGADGASIEIKAQKCIMETNTETKLEFNDELYVTLKPEVLLFSTDPLTSEIIPIEENLTKESQDSEKVLTEIAKMIGNVASLNLRNDIDEDLIDAREQIKNLSNNTYLQQTYDNNPDILDNDNNIIFDILYQRRKYHKAYTSKKMI
ncbi:18400_t:CDS:2, partial [Funneliformis geosporum]